MMVRTLIRGIATVRVVFTALVLITQSMQSIGKSSQIDGGLMYGFSFFFFPFLESSKPYM